MQIITPKTRLLNVPKGWERRPLALNAAATLRLEEDSAVSVLVHVRPRFFALLRAERDEFLGRLDDRVAGTVKPLMAAARRLRVRLVDVPPPFQRSIGGAISISVSIWGDVAPELTPPCPRRLKASAIRKHPDPPGRRDLGAVPGSLE